MRASSVSPSSYRNMIFYVLIQGQVLQKLLNATLGLKVNWGIHFSSIMFNFNAHAQVLYS